MDSRPFAPIQMVRHQAAFPPLQYLRRFTFMSKIAMSSQNSRLLVFETTKNDRVRRSPSSDSPPARVGFLQVPDGRRNHTAASRRR